MTLGGVGQLVPHFDRIGCTILCDNFDSKVVLGTIFRGPRLPSSHGVVLFDRGSGAAMTLGRDWVTVAPGVNLVVCNTLLTDSPFPVPGLRGLMYILTIRLARGVCLNISARPSQWHTKPMMLKMKFSSQGVE
jgi:hypothetical protein